MGVNEEKSRVNGCTPPSHPLQLTAWLFIAVYACFYFGCLAPMLNQSWKILAYIVPGVSLMALLFCMTMTSYIDPAAEPSGKPKVKCDFDRVIENGYCRVCQQNVQPTTKHCRECKKCITRFDHHCFFVNNCIGGRNYRWFIATLVSAIIFFLLLETVALVQFTGYYTDRSIYRDLSAKTDAEFMVFSQPLPHKGWLAMVGTFFAIGCLPLFLLTALFGYNIYQMYHDMKKVEEKQEDEEKRIGCRQDKPVEFHWWFERGTDNSGLEVHASDVLVGAIDFGTTYSGWGILFKHEFQSEPTKSYVRQWNSGTMTTEKTPTVVLVNPDGQTLEAFGYEAEDKYKDLVEAEEHADYFYFRRFKMMLNKKLGERIDKTILLEDEMGRKLPALDVFAMVIRYLVNDMHEVVSQRIVGGIEEDDVHWVLTVPAIWTDSAKKFMREAGQLAGIAPEKLSIALEPEAASIFCRHLPVSQRRDETGVSVSSFPAGAKYIVLDAGGGTVDITVHEVEKSGAVKEVIPPSGGGWGGTMVDSAFEMLIIDLVGKAVYTEFKKEQTEDWLDLWRDFELKKRTVSPDKDSKIVMKLPVSITEIYAKINRGKGLAESLETSSYKGKIVLAAGKLKFSADVFRNFFEKSLVETTKHIATLLRSTKVKNVKAILLVGGFSDSPMLQQKMKSTFRDIDVIIPVDASSSIMRGALIFGHSPKSITQRVVKYTYGVQTTVPFIEGEHPESKRMVSDEGVRCLDIFSKHVEKGQVVDVGQPQIKQPYLPLDEDQTVMTFGIFASELKNPQYTTEGCTKLGEFDIELPDHDGDLNRTVWVSFIFSGTEIEVEAEDEKTGTQMKATADFLG